jgi:hypothetical protein
VKTSQKQSTPINFPQMMIEKEYSPPPQRKISKLDEKSLNLSSGIMEEKNKTKIFIEI